jgi:hypothetical protein
MATEGGRADWSGRPDWSLRWDWSGWPDWRIEGPGGRSSLAVSVGIASGVCPLPLWAHEAAPERPDGRHRRSVASVVVE